MEIFDLYLQKFEQPAVSRIGHGEVTDINTSSNYYGPSSIGAFG